MEIANPESVGLSAPCMDRIGPAMQRYVDEGKLAGILTLAARRGRSVHLETRGMQERETGRSMQPDTIFRIFSMTKPITSVAAMMLVEEGWLRLSDPVYEYLPRLRDLQVYAGQTATGPRLANARTPITIHHLLTHTSGLTYGILEESDVDALYREANLFSRTRPISAMVDALSALPLLFHPGDGWRYSLATDVLGHVVEVISGRSLGDFFQERILEPLGMVDTAFHVPTAKVGRFAANYGPADPGPGLKRIGGTVDSPFARPTPRQSGGDGLVGTAPDYLRFCQMLLNRGELDGVRLLSRKTVELMTMNHIPTGMLPLWLINGPIAGCGFGLGFRVVIDVPGSRCLTSPGEYGWSGAANTYFWIDPVEELIGIFMAQFMPNQTYPAHVDFQNLVYQALL